MILDALHPFAEAVAAHDARTVMPTELSSAELRELSAQLRLLSLFSARTTDEHLLEEYHDFIGSILNPTTEQRSDRVTLSNPQGNVTTGMNPAQARAAIKQYLAEKNYSAAPGEEGTVKDLASDGRIDLVIKTNVEMAQGARRFIQMNHPSVVEQFPAQELIRFESRKVPRDWPMRWKLCAQVVGDVDAARVLDETGRMVALKSSSIWQALGDGEDGSTDTLGNPFPPFAFNSGMGVQSVDRAEAENLGLIAAGEKAQANPLNISKLFSFAN